MENFSVVKNDNVADYILKRMGLHQDEIAQTEFETGKTMTFGDIRSKIRQFAWYLTENGIKGGDMVCLCLKNCTEFTLLLLGSLYVGATCVLVSPDTKPREMEHVLNLTKPKIVFTSTSTPEQRTIIEKIESIQQHIFISDIELCKSGDEFIRVDNVSIHSTALILTSSGSTGLPKGVMLTHNNILTVLRNSGKYVYAGDTFFGVLPFHHAFGLIIMLSGLCEGSHVVTMAKFKWNSFLNAISEFQATVLFLVPSLLVSFAKNDSLSAKMIKSLKRICTGASTINPKYQEIVMKRFPHIELYHSYGMTETCFVTFWGKYRSDKAGSCGIKVDGIKCKVVGANADECGPNEMGEFCFRGPMVMKGYLNNSAATKEAIDENGWLHSGDLGYFDDEGYYYAKERIKEIIKYQGHQVSPSEIESVLMLHKGVTEAAVVGVPDPHFGELPRAYVVKTDSNVTEEELVKFIDVELSSHNRLRGGVCFIESLPKTVSGKILRRELKSFPCPQAFPSVHVM